FICFNFSICLYLYILYCYFFFFQAKDGIRDRNVTGVQTCALPIYDYILKESMEEEHIIELLQRLKQSLIESDQDKQYQIKVERFLKQNNMSLKSKFMEKIIHEPYMNDE